MYQLIKLLTISTVILGSIPASAIEIVANVETYSSVDYYYKKDHKSKFGQCSGRATESELQVGLAGEKSKSVSNEKKGRITNGVAVPRDVAYMDTQTVKWETEVENERTMIVKFNKQKAVDRSYSGQTGCTSDLGIYKISSSDAKMVANFKINVPEDVWIVGLSKALVKENTIFNNTMGGVFSIPEMGNQLVLSSGVDISEPMNYYFVKPFSEINLTVNLSTSDLVNSSIESKYVIDYIGANNCEAKIDRFGGLNRESIRAALFAAKDPQQFHESILYLACLTHQKNIDKVLKTHSVAKVNEILGELIAYNSEENFPLPTFSSQMRKALFASLSLGIFSISNTVLVDLLKFCDHFVKIDYSNGGARSAPIPRLKILDDKIRGVLPLLDSINPKFYIEYINGLKKYNQEGVRYADIAKTTEVRNDFIRLAKTLEDPRIFLAEEARDSLGFFPNSLIDQTNVEETRLVMDQVVSLMDEIHTIFLNDIYKIAKGADELVVYQRAEEIFNQLNEKVYYLQGFFKERLNLYDQTKVESNGFSALVSKAAISGLLNNSDILLQSYGDFFEEYLLKATQQSNSKEMSDYLMQKKEEAKQCLFPSVEK